MADPQPSQGSKLAPPIIFGEDKAAPDALFWAFAVGFVLVVLIILSLPRLQAVEPAPTQVTAVSIDPKPGARKRPDTTGSGLARPNHKTGAVTLPGTVLSYGP